MVWGGSGLRWLVGKTSALVAMVLLTAVSHSGASALSVLNLDFLGRGGGTAGLAARVGDPDNVCWNSSGLAFGAGNTAFAGYMDYLVGVGGGTAGYVGKASGGCGYGVWASYLTGRSLTRTSFDDPTGGRGETFNHGELMSGVAVGAGLLPYLSAGAAVKVAKQDLDDFTSSGLFGDLSVTLRAYSPDPVVSSRPGIYTSYIARNIEVARWGEDEGELPGNSEIGVAFEFPRSSMVAGFSFYFGAGDRREVRWGLEVGLSREFEVRLGYRRRTGRMSDQACDLPWERGLLAGFGLGFGPLRLNYSYEDASPLDNIHRLSVTSVLGGDKQN